MRTLIFLLQKEFKQIFRNPSILKLIIFMPMMQLIMMPLAADFEVKNINIAIVDNDHSSYTRQLVSNIGASGYFKLVDYSGSYDQAYKLLEQDRADLILEIPRDFERKLLRDGEAGLFMAVNAINGVKAGVGATYLARIIGSFNQDILLNWIGPSRQPMAPLITVQNINWFNPMLNYRYYMVPGILVMLVTMIGAYMCALNIVKEKEVGTIEQVNVTPIKKHHFILGKLIPFWLIGVFVFSLGLFGIARMVYGIVPQGSLVVIYSFLALYLIAVLGVGLLISTYSQTQQQAMSLAFFVMMLFILLGGLFTTIDSMPNWAQWIASFNPVSYFIDAMRMIVLKGSGFVELKKHFLVMFGFALFFNTWAILNYKKTS
jgi:ABC-2 type transport system permease protein